MRQILGKPAEYSTLPVLRRYDPWVLRTAAWAVGLLLLGLPGQVPSRPPDIYFAPSRQAVADAMLTLAHVGPNDVVYDLGSGDGRILILAAQKYGARGVGIEIDARLVARARDLAREGAVADRVTFIEGDLFAADIGAADVVTLYLSPSINQQLEPKLRRELKPGARIVSQQFGIGRWPPAETASAAGQALFLWTMPR